MATRRLRHRLTVSADPRRMTDDFETPDPPTAWRPSSPCARPAASAGTEADGLADRLAEIDIHQREARYLLERAGMLERRRQRT